MTEAAHAPLRLRRMRLSFTPSPAVAYAVRFGVATTAALWIGKAPGLVESHSTWILITVLFLVQPESGASLLKAALRGIGTLAGAVTAIVLFGLFAQNPPMLMVGLFFSQMLGAYGFSGQRFQYAWFVFAFTTAIVLGSAMAGQGAVETVAFERASMVGIGILLVFVADSLIWPTRAEPRLRQDLATRARALGDKLRRTVTGSNDSSGDAPAAQATSTLASQLGLAQAANSELSTSRTELTGLTRVAILLEAIASRERMMADSAQLPAEWEGDDRPLAAARAELAQRVETALANIAEALTASDAPRIFSQDLEHALMTYDGEGISLAQRIGRSEAFEGQVADLRDLVSLLVTIETTLSTLEESSDESVAGSLLHFRPDPFRTKIGLRSGIAVIAALLVPAAVGWPLNTMVGPIAFMTAGLTRGAAVLTVTALGVILSLGWIIADLTTLYVAPYLGRAPLAMLYPLALATGLAYIGAKRPALAQLPSIGGLVVFLSVFGGTSPPMDVYGPYNTVCYIAVALGIGTLMGRLMWPATAAGLFRTRVAGLLDLCREAVKGVGGSEDPDNVHRVARFFEGAARQAEQLGALHRQSLHEPVEDALDPSRRTRILSLAMDLMDAGVGYRSGLLDSLPDRGDEHLRRFLIAARHEDETLLESMRSSVMILRGEASDHGSHLREARVEVEDCLDALRSDPGALNALSEEQRRSALVELDSRRKLIFRQLAIEDWLEDWQAAATGRP